MNGWATFSPDGRYRYFLGREWDETKGYLCCVMLNPSTADADHNDPTVERCQRRAQQMGFGGLRVVNLFAFRATDPAELRRVIDPVGPDNDQHILGTAMNADKVLLGWGNHGKLLGRGDYVLRLLGEHGCRCHHLGLTNIGQPRHPLYVSYGAPLRDHPAGEPRD